MRGVSALAAAMGLAACSEDPLPPPMVRYTPSPTFIAPQPTLRPSSEFRDLVEGGHAMIVAGEHMDTDLQRKFYERRNYEPVWTRQHDQANALLEMVSHADSHGLDPELYHVSLLRGTATLSPLQREFLLTDAFLRYADALARGAVPVERRRDDQVLAPEPIDVTEVLNDAADRDEPVRRIEALAPSTPSYRALREALEKSRAGAPASIKGPASRLRTIVVNLERQRWLPRRLPADRVWVNVADERLTLYRGGDPAFATRVVVGEDIQKNQSPEFRAAIDASFFNPPWVIPADIAKAEILPLADRDKNYLTKNKMVLLANGEVEQLPGPDAGLGLIMFDMPNKFDVYLHDTPDRATIFNRDNRRISHGCIRVQNPLQFASLLMDQPLSEINEGIAKGDTTRNDLPSPVPVFVVYQTAFADPDGTLQFRPDFYTRDAAIWQKLQERPHGDAHIAQADTRPSSTEPL